MRYWLSFDLGLRGNYEDLYEWLDNMKAIECGDSLATFVTDKTRDQIGKELKKFLDKRARIYIITQHKGKFVGRFVLGKRKHAAWAGCGGYLIEGEDEES